MNMYQDKKSLESLEGKLKPMNFRKLDPNKSITVYPIRWEDAPLGCNRLSTIDHPVEMTLGEYHRQRHRQRRIEFKKDVRALRRYLQTKQDLEKRHSRSNIVFGLSY